MRSDKKIGIELDELFPVMQEQLAAGGTVKFGPKGTSMLPLIHQGIDSVVISPVKEPLKKYDVPLYRRDNGQFVLHRIVGVNKDGYIMCGDNQVLREYGITDAHIIGVLEEIHTPDKIIKVSDRDYIRYSRRMVMKKRIRWILSPVKNLIYKVVKGYAQ